MSKNPILKKKLALFKVFKRLNVPLVLVQKFSNFFVSLYRAINIPKKISKIIHGIIFVIPISHFTYGLSKPKCLSNIDL